jgi:hypothetical protein
MPQPIDLQSELMRVNAAERMQQLTARSVHAAQQRTTMQQQQQQVEAESQVRHTTEAEEGKVDADDKAGKEKRRKGKKAKPAYDDTKARTIYSADEKPEVLENPEDHSLDISI